ASTAGLLTVSGPVNTDGGAVTLTAPGSGGGVRVNAALGDANTGDITLDAGANDVIFNTAFSTRAGQTASITDGNFADLAAATTGPTPSPARSSAARRSAGSTTRWSRSPSTTPAGTATTSSPPSRTSTRRRPSWTFRAPRSSTSPTSASTTPSPSPSPVAATC